MSNSSQPNDSDTPLSCARNTTRVMPVELVPAAVPRGVTQIIPVLHEFTDKTPSALDNPPQNSRGKTLILNPPNDPRSQVPPHSNEGSQSEASNAADDDPAERCGPTTRIARPSEWLPSAALATIASTQEHSIAEAPIPSVQAADCDASAEKAPTGHTGRFRAFARFSSLSPRHRISLFLAPLALVAAVYVLYPSRTARPTTQRHAPAAQRLNTEATPTAIRPEQPARPIPAPLTSAGPAKSHSQRTLLREAADSVAEGNYARARVLYLQLQTSDPQNPAYGAALRIIDRSLAKSR